VAVNREQRVVTPCRVEFKRLGQLVVAETEDISRHGSFIRTTAFLPVGEVVELALYLPLGTCRLISRVVHLLSEPAARSIGRHPGMGFEFLEGNRDRRALLKRYLDDLMQEVTPPPQPLPRPMRVLIAESNPRLLERLANALGQEGFIVNTKTNGAEAYSSLLEQRPDVILVAAEMPVMDGWQLVRMVQARPGLQDVPMAILSDDASDLTRLNAYRLGVRDYVQMPFTDDELCIRVRRLAQPRQQSGDVVLRGNLGEITLATLLSLLEYESKSGILVLLRRADVGRVFVSNGRAVKVEGGSEQGNARTRLMALLDWREGQFEFTSCEVIGEDQVGLKTTHLLLEHARVKDEARNDARNEGKTEAKKPT
jgi:DNA-binding response OmpR family regulator